MPYKDRSLQKEYLRRYYTEKVAKRRLDWFRDKSCTVCGSTLDLELDHINPADKDPKLKCGNGAIWSWSDNRRLPELAKCQPLCSTCHSVKTRQERMTHEHGLNMYERYRCRCVTCREAKSIKSKRRRYKG